MAKNQLRKTALAISKIPDAAVQAATIEVIDFATQEGGTFLKGRYQLSARIARGTQKNTKNGATLLIEGSTTVGGGRGFWSIKTFGRGAVRPINKKALRLKAGVVRGGTIKAAPAGSFAKGKWGRVETFAEEALPDQVIKKLSEV